jgi:hypothetical protein
MNFLSKKKNTKKAPSVPVSHELDVTERAFKDWKLIVVGFALFVVLIFVANGLLFMKINNDDFFKIEPSTEVDVTSSNRKTLIDVNNFFNARQSEYENYLIGTTTEIDPSL